VESSFLSDSCTQDVWSRISDGNITNQMSQFRFSWEKKNVARPFNNSGNCMFHIFFHIKNSTICPHSILLKINKYYFPINYKLISINNCPTRCNTKQSIYYSASSLYIFRVSNTPIIRSTQNCNYSLRYWSYILCSYLPPTWRS